MSRHFLAAVAVIFLVPTEVFAVAQKPVDQQIAEAVNPLPRDKRGAATVMGYVGGSTTLVVIREGTNEFICLADEPGTDRFMVSCYHRDLEPFMARGRELRASGLSRDEAQAQRDLELGQGSLRVPTAALVSLVGRINPGADQPDSVNALRVLYMPHATLEKTGLPASGRGGSPWLMMPGSPRAHLMIPGERRAFPGRTREDRRRERREHH